MNRQEKLKDRARQLLFNQSFIDGLRDGQSKMMAEIIALNPSKKEIKEYNLNYFFDKYRDELLNG